MLVVCHVFLVRGGRTKLLEACHTLVMSHISLRYFRGVRSLVDKDLQNNCPEVEIIQFSGILIYN